MNASELFSLREQLSAQNTLLCFNGPISRSLIEEFGTALKNSMGLNAVHPADAMDVFSVYIEVTQNIRNYAVRHGRDGSGESATMVISRRDDQHYEVLAGNLVLREHGLSLLQRIEEISRMTPAELKSAYKQQLRQPRDPAATTGAGLGLLEVARRARGGVDASLVDMPDGQAFFSLRVVV